MITQEVLEVSRQAVSEARTIAYEATGRNGADVLAERYVSPALAKLATAVDRLIDVVAVNDEDLACKKYKRKYRRRR